MATLQDNGVPPPRKRLITYGKAARRKIIPDYNFTSKKPQTPELNIVDTSPPKTTSAGVDTLRPRSVSSTPSSAGALPIRADIFDVPSSDDDAISVKLVHKTKLKPKLNKPSREPTFKRYSKMKEENMQSRRKVNLSPAPKLALKAPLAKPTISPAIPKTTAGITKNKLQGRGNVSTMVARPKPKPATSMELHTPKKISLPADTPIQHKTPSPRLGVSDIDIMDVDTESKYISPKGKQMWKGLLDSAEPSEEPTGVSKVKLQSPKSGITPKARHTGSTFKPSRITKPQHSRPIIPRQRLIDLLVKQQDESSDEEESESESSDDMMDIAAPDTCLNDRQRSQSLLPEPSNPPVIVSGSQGSQSQIIGVKITYGRQRSMLAEEDLISQLALDMPIQPVAGPPGRRNRRGSISRLPQLPSFHEAAEDGDEAPAAIRSVHELRQAGANSRFMDEIEDLLDRIGSPNSAQMSIRRSGLLDMAHKLKDRSFTRQFRANNVEQRLFVHLGQETDTVAGFLLVSMLMAVLADGIVPPFVVQLRRQGIARLLIRLLDIRSTISLVVKDRKSNISKLAQKLLLEHHAYLILLPIWDELKPQVLSPHTIALKALEVMVRQTREAGSASDIFSKELTTKLFSTLRYASDEASWDLPNTHQSIDLYLALSALESHSISARTVQDENIWITDYLPIIATTLEVALNRPFESFGVLQQLLLRLTLNVTNNNRRATDVFTEASLMSAMGQAVVAKFEQISRFLTEEDLSVALEHLILLLGVMINFAEWSFATRESLQSLQEESHDPLASMIQIFVENKEKTSQAESLEENQKNVAFGYLAVLLGYMSLLPAISERIAKQLPRKTLTPLLLSIDEFISLHKAVDLIGADEDGYNPQTALTERLESLVKKLRKLEGY